MKNFPFKRNHKELTILRIKQFIETVIERDQLGSNFLQCRALFELRVSKSLRFHSVFRLSKVCSDIAWPLFVSIYDLNKENT